MADLAQIWSDLDTDMQLAVEAFKDEAQKMRAGGVNVDMLKNIQITAYGSIMPLYQVATISTPTPATAIITPWDKGNLKATADALQTEMKGEVMPTVKDDAIYLNFPPLTQEKKEEYTKILKDRSENFRQGLRDIRQSAKTKIEDMKKNGELPEDAMFKSLEDLDETTKNFTEKINEIYEKKRELLLK
ncbi:ribosome recycling factor [bacterium]|nr:ribosome recycling factor [bacterium]